MKNARPVSVLCCGDILLHGIRIYSPREKTYCKSRENTWFAVYCALHHTSDWSSLSWWEWFLLGWLCLRWRCMRAHWRLWGASKMMQLVCYGLRRHQSSTKLSTCRRFWKEGVRLHSAPPSSNTNWQNICWKNGSSRQYASRDLYRCRRAWKLFWQLAQHLVNTLLVCL